MTAKSQVKNPYEVIRSQYVTEKSVMLQNLQSADSNRCVRACEAPKYVFLVDPSATKPEIAAALEEIYSKQKIKVVKVNTTNAKRKRRRVRGKVGYKPAFKKAIVTLEKGDSIENV